VAIKDFSSGPQNYFEPGYFNGDYTEPNVSRAFLQCDIDNIAGGRFVTGEYYLGNYIDGSYYHDNSIRSTLVCTANELSSGVFVTGQFYVGNYIDGTYYHDNSIKSTFTATATKAIGFKVSLQDYYEPGYFVNGYIEPRSAKSTVSCQVTRIRSATAGFASVFQQTAQARLISDINLFAFGDAAIAVEVSRIRGTNITASSVFNVATDFVVERSADADVDAVFSAIIAGLRSRDVNLQTQAAFSFVSGAGVILPFESISLAQSSVSVSAVVTRSAVITTTSTATVSAQGDRIRSSAVSLSSEFAVSAVARKIRDAHLTGTGVAAINCIANFTANGSASIQSTGTVFFNGGLRKTVNANISCHSSIFVSRNAYNRTRIELEYVDISQTYAQFGTSSARLNSSSVVKTLNYPNQIRAYISDQFVVQGWYRHNSGMDGGPLMYCGAGTSISDTSVGDNQWAVRFTVRNLNNQTLLKYQLLTRNSSNQTVKFDSAEVQVSSYMGAPWTQGPSFNPITNNQWNHFAVTKDASNLISFKINGTTVVSGTISSLGTASQYRIGFARFNSFDFIYWDEISYRKDTSAVDLGALTNDVDKQVFLFHLEEYATQVPIDDNSLPIINHSGNANLSSSSTVSAAVGYVATYQAAISASSSVTAVIGKLNEINLVAFADAAVTTNANRIRDNNADYSTLASVSANAFRIKQLQADSTAAVTLAATPNRLRETVVALSTSVAVTAQVNVIRKGLADISANSTVTAVIGKLNTIDLVAFANGTITAIAVKNAVAQSSITGAFTQTALVVKTASGASNQSAQFSQNTDGGAIRNAVIVTQAISSQLSAVVRLAGLFADDLCQFNLTTVGVRTASAQGGLETITSQLTVTAFRIKQLSSALQSSSTLTANAVVVKVSGGTFSNNFAQSAAGNRIRFGTMSVGIVSQVIAVGNNFGKIECTLVDAVNVTAIAMKMVGMGSTLTAIATVNAIVNRIQNAASAVTCNSAVSVSGQTVITANAVFATVASQLSVVVEISGLQSSMSTVATMTVQGQRTRRATAAIQSNSQFTAQGGYRSNFNSALTVNSSVTANVGYRVNATANIASALQFVVEVREIRLDNIVYVVPGEIRVYVIKSETRIHKIRQETRIYTI